MFRPIGEVFTMNTYRHALLIAAALLSAGLAGGAFAAPGGGSTPRTDDNRPNPAKVPLETDFQKAEYLIRGEQYDEAIVLLQRVVNQNPNDTDAWNLLGFATRKLGRNQEALGYYQKALALDAKHKGANEYLGELYLQMDDLPKAEAQLAVLKGICGTNCEEAEDLAADIADYKAAKAAK
jgi:tetratricopeptide (TPR) repeat protein